MNILSRCLRGAERVAVAALIGFSAAAFAGAEPTLEEVKAQSGFRFQEGAGPGSLGQDPAIDLGGSSAERPNVTASLDKFKKGKKDVPSPNGGKGPGKDPLGRRAFVALGGVVGIGAAHIAAAAAGLGLLAVAGPLAFGLLLGGIALGGAAAAGLAAHQSGKRGRSLAAQAAMGVGAVPLTYTLAGKAAGSTVGQKASTGVSKFFGWLSSKF